MISATQSPDPTRLHLLDGVKACEIVCHGRTALERYAVEELSRLLRALFEIDSDAAPGAYAENDETCLRLLVGVINDPQIAEALVGMELAPPPHESQQYVIAPLAASRPTVVIAGGTPQAVLWAVYELAEYWGARFLFEGDVLPPQHGRFCIPAAPICREPLIETRAWRSMNQLPHSGAYWGLADYRQLIDQLAKMRFNVFYWTTYPYNPFVDFQWEGVARQTAELNFGLQIPLDELTIGRELFPDKDVFGNPDFPHAGTPAEKIAASQTLLIAVQSHAASRGMAFGFSVLFTEFADEYKRRLRELSIEDGFEPNPIETGHVGRIGVQREGMDPVFAGYSSVRNPRYLDLVEAQLRAHVEQLSGLDYLVLAPAEFASFGADADLCWDRLCDRYELHTLGSLDSLIQAAANEWQDNADSISPDRVTLTIRAEVCAIFLLDHILHTQGLLREKPERLKIIVKLSDHVVSLFRGVFRQEIDVISTLGGGYLPSDIARLAEQMEIPRDVSDACHMGVSIEDDNIGVSVQQTSGSMHTIMTAAKRNRSKGFWGRQWLTNKIGPAASYVSRACWEDMTPKESYRHLFEGICGRDAATALIAAFECAESLTLYHDRWGLGHSFLVPTMLSVKWAHQIAPSDEMLATRTQCDRFIELLGEAREVAWPSSYAYIDQFINQAEFTRDWLTALKEMSLASRAAHSVAKERQVGDPDGVDREFAASVAHLDAAIESSKKAIQSWAQGVRDRADLGALAALNYYGHRFLCNQRYMQYINANMWAWSTLDKSEADSRI